MDAAAETIQGRRTGMKIRVTEYTTEIEADARELRESNTLGGNIALMLSRCFKSSEPFEDEEEEKGEENE